MTSDTSAVVLVCSNIVCIRKYSIRDLRFEKRVYFSFISRNTHLNNRVKDVCTAARVHVMKRIVAWRYRSIRS